MLLCVCLHKSLSTGFNALPPEKCPPCNKIPRNSHISSAKRAVKEREAEEPAPGRKSDPAVFNRVEKAAALTVRFDQNHNTKFHFLRFRPSMPPRSVLFRDSLFCQA